MPDNASSATFIHLSHQYQIERLLDRETPCQYVLIGGVEKMCKFPHVMIPGMLHTELEAPR